MKKFLTSIAALGLVAMVFMPTYAAKPDKANPPKPEPVQVQNGMIEEEGVDYVEGGIPLYAGQDTEVGHVEVTNDTDYLYVKYVTDEGWCMTETHLHIAESLGEFPNAGMTGNVIPGDFNYKADHDPCVTEHEETVPLGEWPAGTKLYIAAHAVVEKSECETLGGAELLTNGGFEEPVVATTQGWNIYSSPVEGWTVEWRGDQSNSYGSWTRPENAYLELHRTGVGEIPSTWTANSGSQYAELDTDWDGPGGSLNNEPASVTIWQDVETVEGREYDLSFAFSPRPNHADNRLKVEWCGEEVADISASGAGKSSTDWNTYNYSLVGMGGTCRLQFTDMSNGDSYGTFLDDVSLIEEEYEECEVVDSQTAWAAVEPGKGRFTQRGNWATYFTYEVTAQEPELVDTVIVYPYGTGIYEPIPVYSGYELEDGANYRLIASGTYRFANWGTYGIADALWNSRRAANALSEYLAYYPVGDPGAGWYQSISQRLQLWVDDNPVGWEPNNSLEGPTLDHTYYLDVIGEDKTLKFTILDDQYSDNTGFLTVEIYRVY
jgi:hypothetical protein